MTTAHRPTWAPAKGHEEQGGSRLFGSSRAVSAKNIVSHTNLKERKPGQASARDLDARDLKLELEEKEKKHFSTKQGAGNQAGRLALDSSKKDPVLVPKAIDADDSDEEDDEDNDDDDDDDTAALLAELDRIKKERAEEAVRKEAQRVQAEQLERQQAAARGNPLLELDPLGRPADPTFTMKRRWDDDVVFKNQARDETQQKKRFINDTIRSDFHKRFLNRYIK